LVLQGDQIGHVLDTRDQSACPSFNNLSKKPAEELRALLVKVMMMIMIRVGHEEASARDQTTVSALGDHHCT
jgi:hypothetical protein